MGDGRERKKGRKEEGKKGRKEERKEGFRGGPSTPPHLSHELHMSCGLLKHFIAFSTSASSSA